MGKIYVGKFNLGGLSDSKFAGQANSLAKMVGVNVHDEAGIMSANQKMTKVSGSTVDEFCQEGVSCSDGNKYFFSRTSGKVWKVEQDGTTTLVHTTVPTGGEAGCTGARQYRNHIYWATENYLHRIDVADTADWNTNAEENWAEFDNGDTDFHPMAERNLTLFIGDGNYVAQVRYNSESLDDIFSPEALDLASQYRVSALGVLGTNLLVGTYIAESVNECAVFRFNTFSPSFSNQVNITENGVFAFITTENMVFIAAGYSGSIYAYNGEQADFYRKFPVSADNSKRCKVNPASVAIFKGNLALIGLSNVSGNPADSGIYSIGRRTRAYPLIMNLEFPLSLRDDNGYPIVQDLEIGAILVAGTDIFASWKYTGGDTDIFGIDKLDYTAKVEKAYVETMRLTSVDDRGEAHRVSLSTYTQYDLAYYQLPEDTDIVLKYKKHYQDVWQTDIDLRKDTDRIIKTGVHGIQADVLEYRIELLSSGNITPKFEELVIDVQ